MDGIGLAQTDRGSGAYGPHETHDVYVHDNTISTVAGGVAAGFVQSGNDPSYYTSRNIRFHHNTYTTCPTAYWAWSNSGVHQPKPMDRRRQRHHRHLHHRLLRV